MKGLLLKDFYMLSKYCRAFALLILVFCVAGAFGSMNMFMLFYPCIITGMLPVTLISYDEREKWAEFAQTLPYTRAQLVSSKYIVGLIMESAVLLLTMLAQTVRMLQCGSFMVGEVMGLFSLMLPVALIPASILLPFIFKFGSEKGRIAYYIIVGAACAGAAILVGVLPENQIVLEGTAQQLIAAAAAVAAYAVSWLLSIRFYQNREL